MKIELSENFTYKKLLRLVLPTVVMMVVISVYGVVDGIFISNFVGETAFAAINIIMPFIMILGGMGFMVGTGGTALVSKVMGEGDEQKAKRYFTLLVIFTVILGAVLTAIGVAVMRPVAKLLGADEEMIEICVLYGRVCVAFCAPFMLQSLFHSFLAAAGKPNLGLIVTVLAGVTNGVLDALFIVAFRWGVVGAALATGIGQVVGAVIPLVYFARKNTSSLRFTKPKFEIKPILKSCMNGSSELLTNVASSIVSIIYNLQLMHYIGKDGVSAYGVLMYVNFIFLAIEIGYSVGSAPIISYNYGAENVAELKNVFKKSMVIMGVTGVVLSALAQAFAVPLAHLFVRDNEQLFNLTVRAFRLFSFAFICSGVNIFSSSFFTALNDGVVSAIISFMRALVFQILFVFLLPYIWGVDGIWWAMLATEICAFAVCVVFLIAKRRKYRYA